MENFPTWVDSLGYPAAVTITLFWMIWWFGGKIVALAGRVVDAHVAFINKLSESVDKLTDGLATIKKRQDEMTERQDTITKLLDEWKE